jgi:pyruvate kinase
VSDAANAVDDRVDAIMLAGETAAGKYPVEAIRMLDRIIREAESIPPSGEVPLEEAQMVAPHGRAICEAAVTLAARGDAAAIVAITRGGHTAHVLSAFRPAAPIFAATQSAEVSRRLALTWGVVPVVAEFTGDVAADAARIGAALAARGAIASGAAIVLVGVSADLASGTSNVLKLQRP